MINGETIKSLYDDKPTLMRWLKKVEEAVKATALDSITYRNIDGNTRIVAAFADGTEIASDPIKNLQVDELHVSNTAVIDTLEGVQQLGVEEEADIHNLNVDHIDVAHDAVIYGNAGVSGNMGIDKHLNVKGLIMTATGLSTSLLTTSDGYINAEKPVIEVMAGYSAQVQTPANVDIEMIYLGCCKNGNKLTIVHALNITKHTGAVSNIPLSRLTIPSDVGSKIFPVTIGAYPYVDNKQIQAFSGYDSFVNTTAYIQKYSNTRLDVVARGSNLVEEVKYFLRYEVTILLSENLAA